MAVPIWKDYIVTLGSAPSVHFRILHLGETIYTGTAYAKPGSSSVETRINDICADFLANTLPLEDADIYDSHFVVQVYSSGAWNTAANVSFARDWSYDDTFTPVTDVPMDPVSVEVNPGQYLPIWAPGGVYDFYLVFKQAGDFNRDFSMDFYQEGSSTQRVSSDENDGDFYFLNLGDYSNLDAVIANGHTYRVADLCDGYVVYYINAYGGWDSIPVRGRVVHTQGYSRYLNSRVYNNSQAYTRGKENYATEVDEKYRFTIGPLNAEQSRRMGHLLGSTCVYLYDIAKNKMMPVNLTATQAEIKDRGGVLHTYDIDATLARDRVRR